jgi:putative tricarboxylic transport membrane protein
VSGTRVIAIVAGAVGLAAALATLGYPPGQQGVPGPALFPRAVAIALVACAAWLIVSAPPPAPEPLQPGRGRAIGWTAVALVLYAATWEVVPFVPRTALLVVLFLRLLDVSWRASSITAALLAGVVFVVFERMLGVRL